MARTTSVVQHGRLQPGRDMDAILVGSPAWYTWLDGATAFAFYGEYGTFTAHKERRGRSGGYWKAYRKRAGRLHRAYLGTSADLTLDRLNAVAADLARRGAAAPLDGGMPADEPAAPADAPSAAPQPVSAPAEMPDKQRRSDSTVLVAPAAFDDVRPLHLLTTKFTIPTLRPHLVPRPHLLARLDAAISQRQKLILLSAPAGFGKTTLLTAWLDRNEKLKIENAELESASSKGSEPDSQFSIFNSQFKVAWLSLDDGDNHLGQFLAYLIAALETLCPGIGAEAWELLRVQVAHPSTHAILGSLVNALAATPAPIVLALDDYHTISLQVIHEAVAFLLDRMPARMSLIITTRADPPLPLARLRVRGQLTEVRAADLRFTTAEATRLFDRVPGLQLSPAAVTTLAARTEGWVAGLQLAALALQQNAAPLESFVADFSGSHRYVFDYLADEVFQRQPAAVQEFLTQTAILSRLCGPLCAAVTSQGDAQTILEHLDHANLFLIPLDERRQWYRYHHLFKDFLCARLDRAVGPAGRAPFHADPAQITQVIMNLAINARDAMPAGGTLTIAAANMPHRPSAHTHSAPPDPVVCLTVADTGVGMSEEVQRHLFEPFYTTKAPDRGSGLGLATVYGIVNQSGGAIAVASAIGAGTTFTILLPRAVEGFDRDQTSP